MSSDSEPGPNLVTTYAFKGGREYVARMRVTALRGGDRRALELTITDKRTAEDWHSSYDTAYIENLTHKTGNYKQFDVFVTMLQSGLLKTSECVSLDLLTFEDLESLRSRKVPGNSRSASSPGHKTSNRRYLILTYTVEFDRIHYPLPLEYCGPPDPAILQGAIGRLEAEIERLRSTGINRELHRRIEQLTAANRKLAEENRKLSHGGKDARRLASVIKALENGVAEERAAFRAQLQKLRAENAALTRKLRQRDGSASRRPGDSSPAPRRRATPPFSSQTQCTVPRKVRSRSPSLPGRFKASSLSPASSLESLRSRDTPRQSVAKPRRFAAKEIDFGNLESRIHALQKMLRDGINLN